jgi:hypothetical protein
LPALLQQCNLAQWQSRVWHSGVNNPPSPSAQCACTSCCETDAGSYLSGAALDACQSMLHQQHCPLLSPHCVLHCNTHRVPCQLQPALRRTSAVHRQAAAASRAPHACLWLGWAQSSQQHWQVHQTWQAPTAGHTCAVGSMFAA